MPVQIQLRDGSHWHSSLNPIGIAFLMMHLLNHDFRVNQRLVFPGLGIDMKTRRDTGNIPNVETRRTHQYRVINKALAMDLLTGLLLTHLDSATSVRNWCQTRNGLPHSFAPHNYADAAISSGHGLYHISVLKH